MVKRGQLTFFIIAGLVDDFYTKARPEVVGFFFSKYLPNPNYGD